MLAEHIDTESIFKAAEAKSLPHGTHYSSTPYAARYAMEDIPRYRIPDEGIPPNTAYQLIHDELEFDGRPNLNLAGFVNTYMEPEADRLVMENINKNLVDNDEYPSMIDIHQRCITMISHLWKLPENETSIGTATTGSSEALMLGGLAMKRRWQEKRKAAGEDWSRPNVIMGANAQVCIEKFARYFEVEARILPVSKKSNYCLDPELVKDNIDENTIGVFVILGSTYTGHFEPVDKVAKILDEYEKNTGNSIPIHVDAASGGMLAPFCFPDLRWSFEVPRVVSINTSGHKYGLTYVGLGWVLWRSKEYLPEDLIFKLHYLGGTEETFTLNFSRPGYPVILQYFSFLRLGMDGYKSIQSTDLYNARVLATSLEATGYYEVVSAVHKKATHRGSDKKKRPRRGEDKKEESKHKKTEMSDKRSPTVSRRSEKSEMSDKKSPTGARRMERMEKKMEEKFSKFTVCTDFEPCLPVVSFHFSEDFRKRYQHVKQSSVSTLMRVKGWIIPNYPLPPNEERQEILRVVIRESFSMELAHRLITDIVYVTETLMNSDEVDMKALSMGATGIFQTPQKNLVNEDKSSKREVANGGEHHPEKHRIKGIFKRGVC